MKKFFNLRSRLLSAAAISLLLVSGQANAILVDTRTTPLIIDDWADSSGAIAGELQVQLFGQSAGDGLDDNFLEHPIFFPGVNEVFEFTAIFTGPLPPLGSGIWTGTGPFAGLSSLAYDAVNGVIQDLQATQGFLLPAYDLLIGANSVTDQNNRAEIVDTVTRQIIAFSPIPQGVPAPGSLALMGLGLIVLRRFRPGQSRA